MRVLSMRKLCLVSVRCGTRGVLSGLIRTLQPRGAHGVFGVTRFDCNEIASGVFSCLSSPKRNIGLETKCFAPINPQKIMCRHYCEGPSVTLLCNGESRPFLEEEVEDKLLAKVVGQLCEDHGIDICVIETSEERKKYADYVIVVSGGSTRHLKAMTNHLYDQSKKDFIGRRASVSGLESDDWMVVDFDSIVVHLFLPEVRGKYELEKLWSLGPGQDEQYQAMLDDDKFSEIFKNAKLDDFFVGDDKKDEFVADDKNDESRQ